MKTLVLGVLRVYQRFISPFFGPCCRYYPSCSEFMLLAVKEHGVSKGVFLGLMRLCRCHPFHEGGFDPVPDKTNK